MQRPNRHLSSAVQNGPRQAHRPPRLDFSGQSCGVFMPSTSSSPPSSQAVRLALQCKQEVESQINTTFSQYQVKSDTSSYPTPNSGATSGTDYFIEVVVNTRIQTDQFSGEARYMQLTVYVDDTCIPHLKQVQFHA